MPSCRIVMRKGFWDLKGGFGQGLNDDWCLAMGIMCVPDPGGWHMRTSGVVELNDYDWGRILLNCIRRNVEQLSLPPTLDVEQGSAELSVGHWFWGEWNVRARCIELKDHGRRFLLVLSNWSDKGMHVFDLSNAWPCAAWIVHVVGF